MVRYFTCYCHLYAIKKGGSVAYDKFLAVLEASFQPQARLSYWEMTEKRKAEKGALERVKGIEPSS